MAEVWNLLASQRQQRRFCTAPAALAIARIAREYDMNEPEGNKYAALMPTILSLSLSLATMNRMSIGVADSVLLLCAGVCVYICTDPSTDALCPFHSLDHQAF